MMNPMIRRGNHKPLKKPQFGDMLGVHPELVDQVGRGNTHIHINRHAQEKTGNVKHPSG